MLGWAGPNATGTRGGLRCPRVRPCLRTAGPGRAAQGRGHERLPCEAGMLGLASSSRAPGCFALLRAFASWPAGRRAAAAEHQHDPAAARSRARWSGQNPAEVTASRGVLGAAGHKNYQVAGRWSLLVHGRWRDGRILCPCRANRGSIRSNVDAGKRNAPRRSTWCGATHWRVPDACLECA